MQNAIDVASILEKPKSLHKVWSAAYEEFQLFHGPDAGDAEKVQKQLDYKRDSQFLTNLWYFDLEPEQTAEPSRHQYDGYEAAMSGESPQSWHSSRSVAQSDYTPQSPRYAPQSPQYVPASPGGSELRGGDAAGSDCTGKSTCGSDHTEKYTSASDNTGKSTCGSPMDIEAGSSTAESTSPGLHPGCRIQLAEDEEFTELTPQEMNQVLVKLWAVKEAQDEDEAADEAAGGGMNPDGADRTSRAEERESHANPYSRLGRESQASHAPGLTPEIEAAVEAEVKALHLTGRRHQKKRLHARKTITARRLQEAQAAAEAAAEAAAKAAAQAAMISQPVKTPSNTVVTATATAATATAATAATAATQPKGNDTAQKSTKRVLPNLPSDLFGPPNESLTGRPITPPDNVSEPDDSGHASKRSRIGSPDLNLSAETQKSQHPAEANASMVESKIEPMAEADTHGRDKGLTSEPRHAAEGKPCTLDPNAAVVPYEKDVSLPPSVADIDPASVTIDTLSQAWFRAGYLTGLYKSKNDS